MNRDIQYEVERTEHKTRDLIDWVNPTMRPLPVFLLCLCAAAAHTPIKVSLLNTSLFASTPRPLLLPSSSFDPPTPQQ